MKYYLKIKYIYLIIILLFTALNFYYKGKPKIKEIILSNDYLKKNSIIKEKEYINLYPIDNRVSVGKTFFFKERNDWYQISQLSFWRKENLNLAVLEKFFKKKDLTIKDVNQSNYGLRSFNNKSIAYACMNDASNFYYDISHNKEIDSQDLKFWKKVFLKNIKNAIYSFQPNNHECLLVITSNKKFFKKSEENQRNLILNNFKYTFEQK